MKNQSFDFVIVGAGLSGLYSAYCAAKYGTVALLNKTKIEISNSYLAQGGVAAAIGNDDSTELHKHDTLEAGRGLCNGEAVEILVNEGKEIVQSLIKMGMPFDVANGKISLGIEGGHSRRRVLHAGGDATGMELVKFILPLVTKKKNIEIFENTLAYELIRENESCTGIKCYNLQEQKMFSVAGKCTIIASGGAAAIYSRTTNPQSSVGEGISLAFNAGAEIESMEFIQFHPTAFYSENGKSFLISEAVRGEGAYLVNHEGKRFLADWNSGELSPRDEVSEAIYRELNSSGKKNVFLKLDHLKSSSIKNRFGTIYWEALKNNIDITKDLVPVAPAAHYMIGGIKTNLDGETNIKRLYAVGEVASTGVHGANRLASNSLLECLTFADRAVEDAALKSTDIKHSFDDVRTFHVNENQRAKLDVIGKRIGELMWNNVGIIRGKSSLEKALKELAQMKEEFAGNEEEYYARRIKNVVEIAGMITQSALLREESRGCHKRTDFPTENLDFRETIVLKKGTEPRFQKLKQTIDKK